MDGEGDTDVLWEFQHNEYLTNDDMDDNVFTLRQCYCIVYYVIEVRSFQINGSLHS